jgi:hypothetical protein
MKEAGYDHWDSPNTGATNSSGWTGLPGGYYDVIEYYNPWFLYMNSSGSWWTTSESDTSGPYAGRSVSRKLYTDYEEVLLTDHWRYSGLSARCVQD